LTRTILQFPWLGVLSSAGFSLLLVFVTDPDLAGHVDNALLVWMQDNEHKLLLFSLVVLVLIFDFLRFRRAGRDYDAKIKSLNEQVNELFKSKNALQNKAHKYSGHADKLKYFISERLLEYIEYDEKFIHFKSIASEVRHNGVICYDQVRSLLNTALDQDLETEERRRYQDALDSMVYLWDLLDLSTTDNIAMYVANKLYGCEELLYHQVLGTDSQATPFAPTFPARRAAVRAVRSFAEEGDRVRTDLLNESEPFCYEDDQLLVQLNDVGDLLGNENYVLLIVENMINNGLYYTGQKQYRNRYARLSLRMEKENGDAVFRIYNAGPLIDEDVRDKIYQLGFSTKRTKGNQGKGLGLYFVKQLVNGYEGSIDFHNVSNQEDTYVVRIECESGVVVNQIIETVVNEKGKPLCKSEDGEPEKGLKFGLAGRIRSLEVSRQAAEQTHVFSEFESSGKTRILDPGYCERPAWCVDVVERISSTEISFKPLDVMGVEFTIRIPTAESRLDPEYHEATQQTLTEPEAVNEQVKAVSVLIEE
jgi:signal transduction histidine kinase